MRIESRPDEPLRAVYLWRTDTEAAELRDALNDLLEERGPGWHAHVSSSDFQTEISIARHIH